MKLIFLGPPGAGKGTLAAKAVEILKLPHISTGAIFRAALAAGTPLGLRVKAIMDSGKLVDDATTIELIKDRLAQEDAKKGYILDGFPRTIPQAEELDAMGVVIDRVIDIEVADQKIIERISGRRVCGQCGAPYNRRSKIPKVQGICDICNGTLVQRKDDSPEVILQRLEQYHAQTEPLKDFYSAKGKLFIVMGQEEVADTTRLTLAALED